MHLTRMNLSTEESLVAAARRGEPGALRALARSLDDRLAEEDSPLDGAVLAWRSVAGRGPRGGGRVIAGLRGQVARVVRSSELRRSVIPGRQPRSLSPSTVPGSLDGR